MNHESESGNKNENEIARVSESENESESEVVSVRVSANVRAWECKSAKVRVKAPIRDFNEPAKARTSLLMV